MLLFLFQHFHVRMKTLKKKLKVETPIIAQTANTVQKDIDACFNAGMIDYISKPFTIDELIQKISNNLGIKNTINTPPKDKPNENDSLISNTLNLVDGNQEFAIKILGAFVKDLPQNIKQLKESLKAEDEKMINSMGHKIKSSFRMLKLNEMADISLWIEKFDLKNSSWNSLEEKIKILESESQKYLLVAQKHIKTQKFSS